MHPFGVILPDWVAHYANLVIKLDSYFCGVKLDHVAIVSLLSASGTPLDRIPNQRGFGLLIPLASPRSFCVDSCLTRTTPLDTPSAPDFHVSLSFIYHTFPGPSSFLDILNSTASSDTSNPSLSACPPRCPPSLPLRLPFRRRFHRSPTQPREPVFILPHCCLSLGFAGANSVQIFRHHTVLLS